MPAHLITQASPEAIIHVSTLPLMDHQPSKPTLQSPFPFFILRPTWGSCGIESVVKWWHRTPRFVLIGRMCALPLALGGLFASTALATDPVGIVVLFNLWLKALHDAFEPSQSVHEIAITVLLHFARRSTGSRIYAFNVRTSAVRTRVLFVAFHFSAPTRNTGAWIEGAASRATGAGSVCCGCTDRGSCRVRQRLRRSRRFRICLVDAVRVVKGLVGIGG